MPKNSNLSPEGPATTNPQGKTKALKEKKSTMALTQEVVTAFLQPETQ